MSIRARTLANPRGREAPLKDKTWKKAENFETAMKKAGKKFGPAPKKS